MREVILSSRAEADLAAASLWYERERAGLGMDLIAVIDATLAAIGRAPGIFRRRHGEVRVALTPRFPFLIAFVWNEAGDFISVRRILHCKRDLGPLLRE
jgi:plasmid stabilization system protein ParE